MGLIDTNNRGRCLSKLLSYGCVEIWIEPEVSTSYPTSFCKVPERYRELNLQGRKSTREEEEGFRWN